MVDTSKNSKSDISLQSEDEIATIYINKPDKRNTLTFEIELINECEQHPNVKVITF
ncbi:enoyl-CoA hydratase/carnithine racemase [Cytobacillus purgationiresistens]|uniref:Enoyl-CoA hydratase/carnithine racemase n=1 Tax=Cytobacillus purgationiresistens TaxID=863449 RepID=A0ABU0ALR0_9BACI|nr:enoyl-CoA hydratase/carnithine racemase [Cytobacillus purgationiresistens]